MKRIIIAFILCSSIISLTQAQNKLRFGFEASPFYTWLSTDSKNLPSDGGRIGLNLVANGEYAFASNYSIRTGLGLSFGQGGSLKHNEFIGVGNIFPNSPLSASSLDSIASGTVVSYRLNYLEIPFALKMKTPEYGNIKYFAEVPAFTIGLKTSARADIGSAKDENIKGDISTFSLSWGLGAGAEYSIDGNTSIIAGLYYQTGFTDVTTDDGIDKTKAVARRIVLRIGVLF